MSKEKKIKICCIIPTLSAGGMERVMSILVNNFANRDNCEVILVLYNKVLFYPIADNIRVVYPNFELTNNKLFYTIQLLFFLRRKVRSIQPDTILSFGEMYNSFTILSLLFTKNFIYVSDRSKPDKDWGIIHNWLRKILYKKATGIIAQTKYAQEYIQSITQNRNIKTIPNPIELEKGFELIKEKTIITVGRLIPSKRIDLLLKIFKEAQLPGWKLMIVGDGKELNNLKKIAKEYGISDSVIFTGSVKNVRDLMAQCSIFAFTSQSEGFPNVLLEAFREKLPCISFNCIAGPSDIIDDNINGYLIPDGNESEFIEKLRLLASNDTIRKNFSINTGIKITQFSSENVCTEYYNFITSHI